MNRGGSWNNPAEHCTAAYRNTNAPAMRTTTWAFVSSQLRWIADAPTEPTAFQPLLGKGEIDCRAVRC